MNDLVITIYCINLLICGILLFFANLESFLTLKENGIKVDFFWGPIYKLKTIRSLAQKDKKYKSFYYFFLCSTIYFALVIAPVLIIVLLVILQSAVN